MVRTTDHILVENRPDGFRFFCTRCDGAMILVTPVLVEHFLKLSELFGKLHKGCKEREEPADQPESG